jgi:DNA-binding NarL/FixJ family response regulator
VFVVEPHPVTRVGICALIDRVPGLTLAGAAGDLAGALEGIRDRPVALILVEPLAAPNDERLLILALSREAPSARIMALSARVERGYVARILAAGASGFVSKNEPSEHLLEGIDQVLAGRTVTAGVVPGEDAGS